MLTAQGCQLPSVRSATVAGVPPSLQARSSLYNEWPELSPNAKLIAGDASAMPSDATDVSPEIALAVVGAALVIIEYLRDWSYHLIQDLEVLPPYIVSGDAGTRASFIRGMKACFGLSGLGAVTVPAFGAVYLWEPGTFAQACSLLLWATTLACFYSWVVVARLRITRIK